MNVRIASLVKDEADRFLPQLLPVWRELGEVWVQIDGATADVEAHVELLEQHGCKYTFYDGTMEDCEWAARKHLWDWVSQGAEWVVHMDADHMPAGDFRPHLKGSAVNFRVYDMWSEDKYRQDAWWRVRPWWLAINVEHYQEHDWHWSTRNWHSGHLPLNASDVGPAWDIPRECSLLHYGYASAALRERHHAAYMARQDSLTDAEIFHAHTILTDNPPMYPLPFEPDWELSLDGIK